MTGAGAVAFVAGYRLEDVYLKYRMKGTCDGSVFFFETLLTP